MLYTIKPKNFSPKFTVVSCFIEYKGEILLLHRQDNKPEGNTWGMPAGKIEVGEEMEDGLIREVAEETSIVLDKSKIKYFKEFFVKYDSYDFIYHIFHCEFESRPLIKINSLEHKEYRWFKPKDALEIDGIEGLDGCIENFYFS